MAKEKHLPKGSNEGKLLSKDAENTLYGLILVLVSLIGILNNGFIGNFLTYIVAYLFGVFYFVPFLIAIACGLYLILKKKSYLLKVGVVFLGILLIAIASLIGSSLSSNTNNFSSLFSNYHSTISNLVMTNTVFKLRLSNIGVLGGGIIGQFLATLLTVTITKIGAYIVVAIIMIVGLYLAFAKLVVKLYLLVKKWRKERRERIIARIEEDEKLKQEKLESKEKEKEERRRFAAIKANALEVGSDVGVINNSSSHIKKANPFEQEEIRYRSPNIENPTPVNQMFADDIETKKPANPFENEYSKSIEPASVSTNSETKEDRPVKVLAKPFVSKEAYIYPSLDLLNDLHTKSMKAANEEISEQRKEIINQAFKDLNIGATVDTYTIGPSVTRFDVRSSSNSSVNQVVKYIDDFNVRLGGVYSRFAKVVSGKTTSGLEVPNTYVETVTLKEVLTAVKDKKDKPLLIPFGKDISGDVISESMTKFPHMLVAGTSGSGKSVFIHAMIVSLIMRQTPDEVKFVIIDPKRVEFNFYKEMPHLYCPIISDPMEAKVALNKLTMEMNNRYMILESGCFTDIKQYNEAMKEQGKETMPYLVLIIDEYNDLVMALHDIEKPIISLAQKARSAGIHICIATQRPSTNVVTGTLKANLSTKVALMVANVVDSTTILGQSGAENLLGNGDLLLDCPSLIRGGAFVRLQSPYVDRKEIIKVVSFLKDHYELNYNPEFLDLKDRSAMGPTFNGGDDDNTSSNFDFERYERIKKDVMETRNFVSISSIQEGYRANFSTAKSFYARLQEDGIIERLPPGSTNSRGARVIKRSTDNVEEENKDSKEDE